MHNTGGIARAGAWTSGMRSGVVLWWRIVAGVALTASLLVVVQPAGAEPSEPSRRATGSSSDDAASDHTVLVTFASGASDSERRAAARRAGGEVRDTYFDDIAVVEVGRGGVGAALASLRREPGVRAAERDYQMVLDSTEPADPRWPSMWALKNTGTYGGLLDADIDADDAWSVTTGSPDAVVAVLDDGIDYNHPDLAANTWSSPLLIGENNCLVGSRGYDAYNRDCDPSPAAGHYHGTHVAGTIGAVGDNDVGVTGINWRTSLMAVRVFGPNGATTAGILDGLDWIARTKRRGVNVRVINGSFGCMCPVGYAALDNALRELGELGVLYVAAAGNDGEDLDTSQTPSYPCSAAVDNVICVAASDQSDRLSYFSNHGAAVELAAPGEAILSTVPTAMTCCAGYAHSDGTSMAAPHVAGAAALILSTANLTVADLKARLVSTVDRRSSLSGFVTSAGRLNVCRAVGCQPAVVDPVVEVAPSNVDVAAGAAGSFTVHNLATSDSGAMRITFSGVPSRARISVTPNPVPPGATATATVSTGRGATRGTYPITVSGTDGTHTITASLTLVIH